MNEPEIKTTLPGPRAKAIIERDARVVSPSYTRGYPLEPAGASSPFMKPADRLAGGGETVPG